MTLSSFLWIWCGGLLPGHYIPVIIYYTKDVWTENKKDDFVKMTLDDKRDSYLNKNFCTVFLLAKHRGQKSVWLELYIHGLILQLCVSLAHGGLAVLQYWLWWFLLPPVCTVQYSLLTWCLQKNVLTVISNGDWNMQKGRSNQNVPSSSQSLWIISEIKCFYLFQVNVINGPFLLYYYNLSSPL